MGFIYDPIYPNNSGSGFSGYNGGNSGATNTINTNNGSVQEFTLNANTAFTLPDPPTPGAGSYYLEMHLFQDSTGGYVPTFVITGGDPVYWDYGVAPFAGNFNTYPGAENIIIFLATNNRITAIFRNPKDSSLVQTGGAAVQKQIDSFIGQSTVSKRGPMAILEGEVSTTDATVTPIVSLNVPVNSAIRYSADIICFKTDGSSAGGFQLEGVARRAAANVTEVGAETLTFTQEDDAGAPTVTATMDTSNQLVNINAVGVAATAFSWVAYVRYFKIFN